jgi:hypothetical protein
MGGQSIYMVGGPVKGKLAVGRGSGRGFIRWPGSTTHPFGPEVSGRALHHSVHGGPCTIRYRAGSRGNAAPLTTCVRDPSSVPIRPGHLLPPRPKVHRSQWRADLRPLGEGCNGSSRGAGVGRTRGQPLQRSPGRPQKAGSRRGDSAERPEFPAIACGLGVAYDSCAGCLKTCSGDFTSP